jgi:hypothetical protein
MSKQLSYKPLNDIGLNGLNTQNNPATLDPSWLAKAENIVLRESGRISFRKGLKQNILALPGNVKIGAISEYKGGEVDLIFASIGSTIYTVGFSTPDDPWSTSTAITDSSSDWQFVGFNNDMYAFQAGEKPHRYTEDDSSSATSIWSNVDITPPAGIVAANFKPSCGMGHYGRIWVGGDGTSKDVVYYSDTLIGNNFNQGSIDTTAANSNKELCETAGDFWNSLDNKCYSVPTYAGLIDMKLLWGQDEVVAIAPFYGKLVIFGKHNIVIYNKPDDPANMSLDEVINGIGCTSRDSVVSVGDDLFFLSDTGLRSLARTTQNENLPLTDLSANIKDTLIRHIAQSSVVKAVYVENEGIFIMSFVNLNITYVFDLKHKTHNNAPRVTTWYFDSDREPTSVAYTESKGLLIGQKVGSVTTYEGYFDEDYIGDVALTTIEKGKAYIITTVVDDADWSSVGGPSSAVAFPGGAIATNRFTSTWSDTDETKVITSLGAVKVDKPTFSYTGSFLTIWLDLGDSVIASLLKKLKAVISGGSGTIVGLKWYKDFDVTPSKTLSFQLNPTTTGTTSLWGASTSYYGCNTAYDYGLIPSAYEVDGTTLIAGTGAPVGFCSIGAYDDTNSDMSITNETSCLAVTGNVWNAVPNGVGIDQPNNCTAPSSKYAPVYGLKEYNIPLTGSAKYLQFEMSAETNGYVAALQTLTLLYKQGKIR